MRLHSEFVVIAAWLGSAFASVAADDRPSPIKITTNRQADKVEVAADALKTLFSVRSPGGIGQAVVVRTEEKWPQKMIVRLHLNGLESFQVSNGKSMLSVSVSSHADQRRIRFWKDGKEDSPLDPNDRIWLDVRMLDENAKPTENLPLKNGYFELQMPKVFFKDNPRSITLRWIDIYRN
jgi:hypothetical protein